jgi:ferredoxin-type protein NapF
VSGRPFDPARRALLRGRPASGPAPVRPPWVRALRFTDGCTRCGACLEACPEHIIVAGDGGFPEVDFRRGACTFCGRCAAACPEPLFDREAVRPWDVAATIGEACLARRGIVCESCRDACEPRAIRFRHVPGRVAVPEVAAEACTGCGACVAICPAAAITVAAREVHAA